MERTADEDRARNVMGVLGDAVARLDDRGRVIWGNEALLRLVAREPAGIVGHEWTALVEPEDVPAAVRAADMARDRGSAYVDLRLIGPGGTAIPVHCQLLDGHVVVRERTSEDRTEALSRVFVELARGNLIQGGQRSQALAKITETAAEALGVERVGIWLYEEGRTRIREVDLYVRSTKQHSSGTVLTYRQCPRYFVAMEQARSMPIDDAQGDVRTMGFTTDYLKPNSVTSLLDAPIRIDGQMVGVVCHEHTGPRRRWPFEERYFAASIADLAALTIQAHDRLKAEQALKRSEERLRQAQEFEALGRLAGGVAHDFNNVLTAILGYGEVLSLEPDNPTTVRESAQQIKEAARRGSSLTSHLLAFSRRQVLRPVVFDLDAVVRDMAPLVRRMAGSGICVAVVPGASHDVRADRGQFERVVMNLAGNAKDAMPSGGLLVLRTFDRTIDAAQATAAGAKSAGTYVVMEVEDTGTGMDESTKAHLFEPFFTTKPSGVGTGLGLATVQGIVQQGGGFIEVDSEPGEGSRFRIHVPAVAGPKAQASTPPGEGAGRTVLLVEDDEPVRALVHRALSEAGYVVLEAKDGGLASRLGRLWKGPLDALVADVVLPDVKGTEVARRVSALRNGLAVLFVSGFPDQTKDLELGPRRRLLLKPFTPETLRSTLRESLAP